MVPRREIPSWRAGAGSEGRLAAVLTQEVVPVFGGGTQAVDGGMKVAHVLGHEVAGGIGVKAAVDGRALLGERAQPLGIRPGS